MITGPTGSGKSAFAVDVAKLFNGEIINADSVQVYQGADIGSAKPSAAEQRQVPHHLLSHLALEEDFDVGQFRLAAGKCIADITGRGKLPIVCGGTGLYVRALLSGLVATPEITPEARERLAARSDSTHLHAWLADLDPYTAESLEPHDRARLERALLVTLSSGLSLRRLQDEHRHQEKIYRALVICFLPEREALNRILDARIDEMLAVGFLDEADKLRRLSPQSRVWSTLGYRHACMQQDGVFDSEQMLDEWKRDTRRFAKRQYTWWRHQPRVLGWQQVSFDGSRTELNVKSEADAPITDRLSDAIKCFLERREAFSADDVFFLVIENFANKKNVLNMSGAHCQE